MPQSFSFVIASRKYGILLLFSPVYGYKTICKGSQYDSAKEMIRAARKAELTKYQKLSKCIRGSVSSSSKGRKLRPHRKISGIGVSWQKKYGRAGGNFLIFLTVYVCTYVYRLEGHWDARHVRPLTFNTHIFCQFYSMQQHADSIIGVNGSCTDGGEGPQGPCYLLQTVMNESRKRRPNSICMFTSSSSAASSSLPCALSDVDVYDVSLRSNYIAYTYKNLPQCCCSVHANTFSRRMRIQSKKKNTDGLSYGQAGNPNPTYFSVWPY